MCFYVENGIIVYYLCLLIYFIQSHIHHILQKIKNNNYIEVEYLYKIITVYIIM